MSEELKPCPFCGAHSDAVRAFPRTCNKDTPYDARDRAYPIVRCLGCGASQDGKDWTGIETAIAKWNARPAPAVQVPEIEKLEAARQPQERGEAVAWLRKNGFRFNGDIEPQDDSELPLYAHPPADAQRIAELESAHRAAAWRADSAIAQLTASREREGRMRELLEDMRYELHQYTEGFDVIWGRVDAALAAEKGEK